MNRNTRILCYGDSNTYGYVPAGMGRRYSENIRWPMKLASLLGEGFTVIEEGLPGRTADANTDAEAWKDGRAYLCAALSTHRPVDLLVLMLGTNDLKESFHRSAEDIAATMDSIIARSAEFLQMKQGYVPQILLIAPPCLSKDILYGPFCSDFDLRSVQVSKELAEAYAKVAEKYEILFLDGALYAGVSAKDGLHMEMQDHLKLAEAADQKIREWAKDRVTADDPYRDSLIEDC